MRRYLLPAVLSLSVLLSPLVAAHAASYTFTTFDVPGATFTFPFGINNRGQIVGTFRDGAVTHGFLKDGATFTTIDGPGATDVPGATFTEARGINTAGRIVGFFEDATGGFHGFLATPER